jgi:hypothetical protein
MKTIMIMLLLCCIAININAQIPIKSQRIQFHSFIESGLENRDMQFNDVRMKYLHNCGYASINVSACLRGFTMYVTNRTYVISEQKFYLKPKQIEYYVGLSYEIRNLKIGIEHLCSHSIDFSTFYDSYDRLSIKYKLF